MRLDESRDLFSQLISATASFFNIYEEYVEKDYWLTLLLKHIFSKEKGYVFKGGTSLSKCYKLVKRFSEDIDISYSVDYQILGVNARSSKFRGISNSIKEIGLEISNTDKLRRDRYFNQFKCPYNTLLKTNRIDNCVIVELAAQTPSFPSIQKPIQSFIGEYLTEINRSDLVKEYELDPFEVSVQTIERTLVDKTFAICDYYCRNKVEKHSRHLYDLYKLLPKISFDESTANLFNEIREYRKRIKVCYTAINNIKLYTIIEKIIFDDAYKSDYLDFDNTLLYEEVSYDECIDNLKNLLAFLKQYDI